MEKFINPKVKKLENSRIREFSDLASKYNDVISLTLGESDLYTPEHIKRAGQVAIEENYTKYAPSSGYSDLLDAASGYIWNRYKIKYNPENEVLATNGTSEGIYVTLRTILEADSEVILPAPIYPGYEPVISLCGAKPIYIDTRKTGFKITADQISNAITDKTRCIILSYPMNPTGVNLTQDEIGDIINILKDKKIFVLTDEIYSEYIFEGEYTSIAKSKEIRDKIILVNGLSKSHSMTGWRIGFLFAPAYLMNEIKKIHQYIEVSVSSITQRAAIEALKNGDYDTKIVNQEYHKRCDYVYKRLVQMGIEVIKPQGTFYMFPSIKKFNKSSFDFAIDLLKNAKVAVLPGDAFTEYGEGYVRISVCTSMDKLKIAMDRMEKYILSKR
ncbi:MAG: aminotransferase A [Clostridium sp.]|nr:aminotransferase A [Clostridium sp.]